MDTDKGSFVLSHCVTDVDSLKNVIKIARSQGRAELLAPMKVASLIGNREWVEMNVWIIGFTADSEGVWAKLRINGRFK